MENLVVAALVFVGTHVGLSSTPLRAQLVGSLGERRYLLLYSLVSLVTLVWLIRAYGQAPKDPLWLAGAGLRHLAVLLMAAPIYLVVSGLATRNPTAVGQTTDADAPEPATGILRVTRHPFLWGAGLWAALHALSNGDLASLVFFGSLAVLALGGTALIDGKRGRLNPPGWGVFVQRTSSVPFLAILQGRQRLTLTELPVLHLALAAALYVGLIVAHPWLFGVPAWPG